MTCFASQVSSATSESFPNSMKFDSVVDIAADPDPADFDDKPVISVGYLFRNGIFK